MKRAPIVLAGTAIGLVGLVSYHTTTTGSVGLSGTLAGAPTANSASSSATKVASAPTHTASGTSTGSSGTSTGSSGTSTTKTSSTTSGVSPALTRSAIGRDVQYGYGNLAVKVTMNGSTITNVSMAVARVVDGQSASIDQYVLPILRKQALSAQGASIQGISGASYTSQAYAQSLQSAIDKLTTAHA